MPSTNTSQSTSAVLTIAAHGDGQLSVSLTALADKTLSLPASLSIVSNSNARLAQLGIEYMQSAGANADGFIAQLAIEYMQSNQTVKARIAQLAIEFMQAVTFALSISPANPTSNGFVQIEFHAQLVGSNGVQINNPNGTWSISGSVGAIDPDTGIFTPNGTLGTVVVTFTTSEF
jgi:hypothetical protein